MRDELVGLLREVPAYPAAAFLLPAQRFPLHCCQLRVRQVSAGGVRHVGAGRGMIGSGFFGLRQPRLVLRKNLVLN